MDSSAAPSPSLLRRLVAITYDSLLVLPLVMISVALFMGARSLLGFGAGPDGTVQLDANVVRLIELLSTAVFFCAFWMKNGQTLGMQAWRIKLVNDAGDEPGLRQCVVRFCAALLSAGCFGLGYLWCLFDRRGRYWHDHLSGTYLVLLPKRSAEAPDQAPPERVDTKAGDQRG